MINNLTEIDRAIINNYIKVENETMSSVYSELKNNYPSLQQYVINIETESDCVESLEKTEFFLREFKNMAFESLGHLVKNSPDYNKMKKVIKLIKECEQYNPIFELYYSNLPKIIKKVASEQKIKIKQVIKNEEFRDEILRKICKKKEQAETIFKISSAYKKSFWKLGKLMLDVGMIQKRSDSVIPSEEAFIAYIQAIEQSIAKDLDRIYKPK